MSDKKKYTFAEFLAAGDSDDFDKIDEAWLKFHKEKFVPGMLEQVALSTGHAGDCTKQSHPCDLCMLETLLDQYRQYYFNEEKFREENGV